MSLQRKFAEKKNNMVSLKKGRQRQHHAYTRYFLLLRGLKTKLFVLDNNGGV